MNEAKHKPLQIGDLVVMDDYDYAGLECWVIGIVTKRNGGVRYVVEDERGLVLTASRQQLVFMARPKKGKKNG